jgi:hypothetical protein
LKELAFTKDTRLTASDKLSIMKYFFEAWMFKNGDKSGCFGRENLLLSENDKKVVSEVYPKGATLMRAAVEERIKALETLSRSAELPADLKMNYQTSLHDLAMQKSKLQ